MAQYGDVLGAQSGDEDFGQPPAAAGKAVSPPDTQRGDSPDAPFSPRGNYSRTSNLDASMKWLMAAEDDLTETDQKEEARAITTPLARGELPEPRLSPNKSPVGR